MIISRLKLPYQACRSVYVPVPVIWGLKRFLTMSAVAEVEDSVFIIDCVAILYEEGEGGEHVSQEE